MADGAVVVGTDGQNLHFTPIKLRDSPAVADDYTRRDASQVSCLVMRSWKVI